MGIKTFADYDEKEGGVGKEGTTTYAGGEKSGIALDQGPPRSANERMELYANGFRMLERFRPFSDPANRELWEQIRRGEAPQELREKMLQYPEGLTVEVVDKSGQEYKEPDAAAAPAEPPRRFEGQGYTLSAKSAPAKKVVPKARAPTVDPAQPTVRLTFRLVTGQRITQDFNVSHTVADVYSYVAAVSGSAAAFKLVAGFPPAPISDDAALAALQHELLVQQPV